VRVAAEEEEEARRLRWVRSPGSGGEARRREMVVCARCGVVAP
jgi:hypothetical protein